MNQKQVQYFIRRTELPANGRDAHARLTAMFWALFSAFPDAHIDVTSHKDETVLHVSQGLDRARAEKTCANIWRSWQQSSAEAMCPKT